MRIGIMATALGTMRNKNRQNTLLEIHGVRTAGSAGNNMLGLRRLEWNFMLAGNCQHKQYYCSQVPGVF
jgi:hypothetical protein